MLLGVIVIAVLFPVFVHAGHGGGPYSCASNLRQLGLSCSMYYQDWDDHYPRAATWMDAMSPYVLTGTSSGNLAVDRAMRIYRCPTLQAKNANAFGYTYNSRLAHRPY